MIRQRKLVYVILALVVLGLLAVLDASIPQALNNFNDKYYYFKNQAVMAVIGVVAMVIFSKINYKVYEKIATPAFFISIILLIAVLIPGVSYAALGARRWISIGNINFQPSEIVKIIMAVFLAKLAANKKNVLSYYITLGLVAGLIMLEPDLGTVMVIFIIFISQFLVSGHKFWDFAKLIIFGLVAVSLLIVVSPYRRDRVLTFFQASQDPLGKDYHARQILLGLGSGGFGGVGIGQSRQKFLFLPEASTDSIFAVIAEETGFIGASVLLLLFGYFVYCGFRIVHMVQDDFGRVLAVGIVSWIGGQAFLNVAAMVMLVPLTGIPLPFFSHGGTALLAILISCGILLNIGSKHNHARK